ncbi:TonB-dependent receptor [Hahella sp. SMD15-11]|uniref:TonB-dependent receptor n=1 Tax=Thermohahella caldifontis TaxID=3142973 RepID=A0AB39UT95_9GAMM
MKSTFPAKTLLLLPAMLGAVNSNAQTNLVLQDLVVTATRAPRSLSDLPKPVQVIDQDQIEESARSGATVSEVLARVVPGMAPDTQLTTDFTQTLRGRDVLVLIDGIPQTENRRVSRQLSTLNLDQIERIEVVPGATAVYGSGGTGGIVNVITREAVTEGTAFSSRAGLTMNASTSTLSRSRWQVGQSVSHREQALSLYASLSLETREDSQDATGQRLAPEPAQIGRDDSRAKDFLFKLGYELDDSRKLTFTAELFEDDMNSRFGPNYGPAAVYVVSGGMVPVENQAAEGLELDAQPYSHRKRLEVAYTDSVTPWGSLNLVTYFRDRDYQFFPFPAALPNLPGLSAQARLAVNQSRSQSWISGTKLVFDRKLTEETSVTWGVDLEREKGRQHARSYDPVTFLASNGLHYRATGSEYDYGPSVTTTKSALFGQLDHALSDALTLSGGLRYERIRQKISSFTSPYESLIDQAYDLSGLPAAFSPTQVPASSLQYNTLTSNLGFRLNLANGHSLFASYSEGYELPDTARLLRNAIAADSQLTLITGGAYTPVDQIDLEAIRIRSFEAGWEMYHDRFTTHLTGFYNRSDKTAVFNSDYSVSVLTQPKRIYGAEAALDLWLSDTLTAGVSYLFTEGRTQDSDTGIWTDLDASEVPPEKWTTYVAWQDSDARFRLETIKVQDYRKATEVDAQGNLTPVKPIEGYLVVNASASFDLPAGTLGLGLQNLFNRKYKTVYAQWAEATYGTPSGIQARGRTLTATYQITY